MVSMNHKNEPQHSSNKSNHILNPRSWSDTEREYADFNKTRIYYSDTTETDRIIGCPLELIISPFRLVWRLVKGRQDNGSN